MLDGAKYIFAMFLTSSLACWLGGQLYAADWQHPRTAAAVFFFGVLFLAFVRGACAMAKDDLVPDGEHG